MVFLTVEDCKLVLEQLPGVLSDGEALLEPQPAGADGCGSCPAVGGGRMCKYACVANHCPHPPAGDLSGWSGSWWPRARNNEAAKPSRLACVTACAAVLPIDAVRLRHARSGGCRSRRLVQGLETLKKKHHAGLVGRRIAAIRRDGGAAVTMPRGRDLDATGCCAITPFSVIMISGDHSPARAL